MGVDQIGPAVQYGGAIAGRGRTPAARPPCIPRRQDGTVDESRIGPFHRQGDAAVGRAFNVMGRTAGNFHPIDELARHRADRAGIEVHGGGS